MRTLNLSLLCWLTISLVYSQPQPLPEKAVPDGEFQVYGNGLIYSEPTMKRLHHIVDSLNLRFRTCEPRTFQAKAQAWARQVSVNKDVKAAWADLRQGLPVEAFIRKYPGAVVSEPILVTRTNYTNYEGKAVTAYNPVTFSYSSNADVEFIDNAEAKSQPVAGKWFMRSAWNGGLTGLYFLSDFETPVLPAAYAHMVQYVDCLIDSSATVFLPSVKAESWVNMQDKPMPPAVKRFLDVVVDEEHAPEFPLIRNERNSAKSLKAFGRARKIWQEQLRQRIDVARRSGRLQVLVDEAVTEALRDTFSNAALEQYAIEQGRLADALFLKRSHKVVGGCSQDSGPRDQMVAIASLSAQTAKWDVFLTAHLNVMNDRVDRISDGSYAWAGRKTYIRELEEVAINVPDLLLGTVWNIEAPGHSHYRGNISRIGRALGETGQPDVIEGHLLRAVSDSALDPYNRLIAYWTMRQYVVHLQNEGKKKALAQTLASRVKSLPPALQLQIGKANE